jgi:hypothetical protein
MYVNACHNAYCCILRLMKANVLKQILFCGFIFFLNMNGWSQSVLLKSTVVDSINLNKIITLKTNFKNKSECLQYIQQIPVMLQAKGFATANIDSVKEIDNIFYANIFVGKKWQWGSLHLPEEIKFQNNFINTNINSLPESILHYYENNGHPFAQVSFDSIYFLNNTINANLKVNKGFSNNMDSIRVYGKLNLNNKFLQHHLNLFNNEPYNAEKLKNISAKLKELPYLKEFQNWDVLMLSNSYILNLYLEPINQNKLDAIIGFLPNNNQTDGKLLFTIDAKLNLFNAFAKGEQIALNWQQIQPQSPRIDLFYHQPFVFNSKLGLSVNFNLYKRDSAFLNINSGIAVTVDVSKKSSIKISLNNNSSRIIDADTLQVIATKKLPDVLDLNVSNIGIAYVLNNSIGLTYAKRKGLEWNIYSNFGQKRISPNNTITNIKSAGFNYKTLYDSIATNTYQIKAKMNFVKYSSISKQMILKNALQYGLLLSGNYLQNELFQIGGFKLLRGFDEENIFTNQYIVSSNEIRFLFNNDSYFFGFTDLGFTENKIIQKNNSYLGGGIGLALATKQGLLNVSFAVGKRNDLPFSFKASKIHIGIISNF